MKHTFFKAIAVTSTTSIAAFAHRQYKQAGDVTPTATTEKPKVSAAAHTAHTKQHTPYIYAGSKLPFAVQDLLFIQRQEQKQVQTTATTEPQSFNLNVPGSGA